MKTRHGLAPFVAVAWGLAALALTACEREDETAADDVVIITPDPAVASRADDAVITLEAITPEPLPGGDDPFCVAVVAAITDYNDALQTYIDGVLAATTQAALTNDLTAINDLGMTVNELARDATDGLDDALVHTDDKAATAAIEGMIEYLEVYVVPVGLIMVSANDYETFNTDLTVHTHTQLAVITAQTGHARALETYTIDRCGVEFKVLTAG